MEFNRFRSELSLCLLCCFFFPPSLHVRDAAPCCICHSRLLGPFVVSVTERTCYQKCWERFHLSVAQLSDLATSAMWHAESALPLMLGVLDYLVIMCRVAEKVMLCSRKMRVVKNCSTHLQWSGRIPNNVSALQYIHTAYSTLSKNLAFKC